MCDAKGKKTKVLGLEFPVKELSGGLRPVIVARARNNKATIVDREPRHHARDNLEFTELVT